MRITLKKVLVYICSVCIIDSVILCIYVSTNRDKQAEIFRWVAQDRVDHQPSDETYFINEPHFERLIKEYRNQEEYPRRVLFEKDNNDEQLKGNIIINQTFRNDASVQKVNFDNLRRHGNDSPRRPTAGTGVPQSVEYKHGGSDNNSPNTNIIDYLLRINHTKTNQLYFKLGQPQASERNVKYNVEQKSTPLADRRQNKPIYVKYIKLSNNQFQPVLIDQPVKLDNKLPQKREIMQDGRSHLQRTVKSTNNPSVEVDLNDVFLAVKTTKKYHESRLQVLLDTWVSIVPNQVYFFTDADDEDFQQKTNGHMINTKCPSLHVRAALCCKMMAMFDSFVKSNKSWFCHVDDDNYLNLGELRKLLDLYQPDRQDVYLGRSSTTNPIEAFITQKPMQKYQFWFGTGGAGVCISRALANKMVPYISGGKMQLTCESIRMPDDVTIGYINEVLLNVPMVHIRKMNSHLQELWSIKPSDIKNQITLSYRIDSPNKITINNPAFPIKDDPTRFKSIHCIIYPHSTFCPDWQG